jgi:hypothetical protein
MYLHLVINRKKYKANASFLTLLRYRAQYGVSYLIDDSDEKWPRILYIAISPECSYIRFCKELSADSQFVLSALYLQKELLRCDREVSIQGENHSKELDELRIVAMYAAAGLPSCLLGELSLFQVVDLILLSYNVKNGKSRREMTGDERKGFYGITPEKEQAIEEYLREHGEVIDCQATP